MWFYVVNKKWLNVGTIGLCGLVLLFGCPLTSPTLASPNSPPTPPYPKRKYMNTSRYNIIMFRVVFHFSMYMYMYINTADTQTDRQTDRQTDKRSDYNNLALQDYKSKICSRVHGPVVKVYQIIPIILYIY